MRADLVISLLAGFFAGSSACAVPVYPALLNRLTASREDKRLVTVFFVIGIAGVYFIIYALLGLLLSLAGAETVLAAETWRGRMTLLGALFSWVMAYHTFKGGLKMPTLKLFKGDTGGGYTGALLSGAVYGTILSPCNTPFVITGILPAIATKASVFYGIALLASFSLAMGIPFLFLGWAYGSAMMAFDILRRNMRKLEIASAIFLVIAGFYFLFLFSLTL